MVFTATVWPLLRLPVPDVTGSISGESTEPNTTIEALVVVGTINLVREIARF